MQPAGMSSPSFPQLFERVLVPGIFRPWAEELLNRVTLPSGGRVLDVGCGTGIVARLVRERSGPGPRISGLDINPEMIAVARSLAPDIEWHQGNAAELPFRNGSFDLVLAQQVLQFVPDRAAAVREVKRVLAPGGRVAIATWRSLEENPLYLELDRLAVERFGPHVDRRFSFGDGEALRTLLVEAGFRDIRIEVVSRRDPMPEGDTYLGMNLAATAEQVAEMSPEQRTQTLAEFRPVARKAVGRFFDGDVLMHEAKSNLALAVA